MFDDLGYAIGADDGVVYHAFTPSVAVLYAVAKDNTLTKDSVCPLSHTLENTIACVGTISQGDWIGHLTEGAVRAKLLGAHGGNTRAFATREGKDGYNHTQCQE